MQHVDFTNRTTANTVKVDSLFNALVTFEHMLNLANPVMKLRINEAIDYLKGSKHYSDSNQNSTY